MVDLVKRDRTIGSYGVKSSEVSPLVKRQAVMRVTKIMTMTLTIPAAATGVIWGVVSYPHAMALMGVGVVALMFLAALAWSLRIMYDQAQVDLHYSELDANSEKGQDIVTLMEEQEKDEWDTVSVYSRASVNDGGPRRRANKIHKQLEKIKEND